MGHGRTALRVNRVSQRVIKETIVITEEYHRYQLHIKFYPVLSCQHLVHTHTHTHTHTYGGSSAWISMQQINYRSYRGADKSLARSGRKQATATEDVELHITYL